MAVTIQLVPGIQSDLIASTTRSGSIDEEAVLTQSILVGCAAGFSGDRVDVALPVVQTLIRRGAPSAIIFENLAERTLAQQQITRRSNPDLGYEPLLELEIRPILGLCLQHGVTIVSNFGAANPHAAARKIIAMAAEMSLERPRIAVVTGDDLSGQTGLSLLEERLGSEFDRERFVCANAYQGSREIADAILAGAQIVVTGRVADPCLTLGPVMAHYGWQDDEWDFLAGASMAGHLLECGAQVTGGSFADPGYKDIPEMDQVGFPIAEIFEDGSCIISKADQTGGRVSVRTVKEQLLYEVHDPGAYITPDVVADISDAQVTEVGPDQVRLTGVKGHPRTSTLKANVFFDGGWFGEGEISYAGPNALARARLARDILQKRLGHLFRMRFDLIGLTSIFNDDGSEMLDQSLTRLEASSHPDAAADDKATDIEQRWPVAFAVPMDIRLRVSAQHMDLTVIERLLREVTALWTCGPAGGGGARVNKRQRLSTSSCLIDRNKLPARFEII